MQEIFNRRSVRRYADRPIEKEKLEKLLRAAMQAPSAGNQQPWEFIVVTDRDMLCRLSDFSPYAKMLPQAAAAVVVLSRTEGLRHSGYCPQDLGAAVENMLLEAVHLGLGGVWMGCMPVEERMQAVAQLMGVPDNLLPFAVVAFGYPAEEDANRFTDRYDPERVYYGRYGGRDNG